MHTIKQIIAQTLEAVTEAVSVILILRIITSPTIQIATHIRLTINTLLLSNNIILSTTF